MLRVGGLLAFLGLAIVIFVDIALKNPAASHSLGTLVLQYIFIRFMILFGKRSFSSFDRATKHVRDTQERLLLKLLRTNSESEFGKEHRFADVTSRDEFRERIKLNTYADFAPYINRMTQGE